MSQVAAYFWTNDFCIELWFNMGEASLVQFRLLEISKKTLQL